MKRSCLVLLTVASSISCTRGEPPSPSGDAAVAPLQNAGSAAVALAPSTSTSTSTSTPTSTPTPTPTPTSPPSSTPSSADGGGDVGEQTRDKPSAASAAFVARMRALLDAIAQNKPELAHGSFFPLGAYEKVKAVGDPARDYRFRLLAAYDRDIRDLNKAMGAKASKATFVAIDVPEERGRWVEPGEEYNKLGYYRVFGSKLRYEVDGKERSIPIKSLISWRGEWYVVHLSGMK